MFLQRSWFELIITIYVLSSRSIFYTCILPALKSWPHWPSPPDGGAGQGRKADPLQGQLGRRGHRFETLHRRNESCPDYRGAAAVHQMPCANRACHRCEYRFGVNLGDSLQKWEGDRSIKKTTCLVFSDWPILCTNRSVGYFVCYRRTDNGGQGPCYRLWHLKNVKIWPGFM